MDNNTIKIASDYLKRIEKNLNVLEEKKKTLKTLEDAIKEARASENVGIEELGQKIDDFQKLAKEIEGLKKLSFEYNALSKMYNGKFERLTELRAKVDKNINDVLYGNGASANLYKTSTEEEKIEFEMLKPHYESEIEFIKNSMNDLIEPLEKLEQETKNAIKGKDDNYRDLTLEEAKNQDELVNNAKSLEGISEKTDDSIKDNENFRELTYEEAKSIINYGEGVNNGELSEEEIIKNKPRLDDLMKETGAQDMNELYEKAREVVNKNKSNINGSPENKTEFVEEITDVGDLTEEQAIALRNELGLEEGTQLTNNHLAQLQAQMAAEAPLKEEPEKKTLKERFKVSKIGQALENLDNAIAKNTGKAIMAAIAIGAVALTGGLALSAAGLTVGGATMLGVAGATYQEYNKGKKL